jgi:hypothetical protein
MGYRNMYYCHKSTHDYVDANQAIGDSSVVPGFITSVKTRPLIINKLDEYIRNKVIKLNSLRTVRELEKFIWVSGKPEAQKGYNDDLVLSLAIASWVREMALIVNQKDVDLSRAMLMAIGKSNVTLSTAVPGMEEYKSINISNTKRTYQEYAWLFKG